VNTGLRLGELLGLRWQDVDGDVLHVRQQWTKAETLEEPKTKHGRRRVPLSQDVADSFAALRFAATYPGDEFPVFAMVNGQHLAHRTVQRGFDRAREVAREVLGKPNAYTHDDGRPVSFHDLRHAFASKAASRGVPVGTLSTIMGHADVGVTQSVYIHLYGREQAEQDYREAMDAEIGK
jgi:integrase